MNNFKEIISDLMVQTYSVEDEFIFVKALYPYAEKLNHLLAKEEDLSIALKMINEDPLVYWLNSDRSLNFSQAKKKMIRRKLIAKENFQPSNIVEFRNKYTLEYMCSVVLRFLMDSKKKLREVPALKRDHEAIRKRMTFIDSKLDRLGTIPFENSMWQFIFHESLKRLLKNNNRNIYSTGKYHKGIAAELMCKKMIHLLCFIFKESTLSQDFVINVSQTITAHFFSSSVDTKEAKALVKKIKTDLDETKALWNKTFSELLGEYSVVHGIIY